MPEEQQARSQVLEVMDRFNAAIRNRDLEAVLEVFDLENPTEVAVGPLLLGAEAGELVHGGAELREFFERFLTRQVGFSFRWHTRIVWVLGEVAWAFADGAVQTSSEAGRYEHPYRITGVFRRSGAGWRWVLYHGSEPVG